MVSNNIGQNKNFYDGGASIFASRQGRFAMLAIPSSFQAVYKPRKGDLLKNFRVITVIFT
jgi:hypothetical protein